MFPAPRSGKPITGFSKHAFHAPPGGARCGVAGRLHDLRRSFATTLGQLGEDDEATIDAVLESQAIGIPWRRARRSTTSRRAFRLRREALERWGELLEDALEGRFPGGGGSDSARPARET